MSTKMKRILYLDSHKTRWNSLKGKNVLNKNVLLDAYNNICMNNGPIFLYAENVLVHNCDEEFICRWINNCTFPVARNICIHSFHSDPSALCNRFRSVFVVESNVNRSTDHPQVNIITEEKWDELLCKYDEEKMIFTRNSYCTPLIE